MRKKTESFLLERSLVKAVEAAEADPLLRKAANNLLDPLLSLLLPPPLAGALRVRQTMGRRALAGTSDAFDVVEARTEDPLGNPVDVAIAVRPRDLATAWRGLSGEAGGRFIENHLAHPNPGLLPSGAAIVLCAFDTGEDIPDDDFRAHKTIVYGGRKSGPQALLPLVLADLPRGQRLADAGAFGTAADAASGLAGLDEVEDLLLAKRPGEQERELRRLVQKTAEDLARRSGLGKNPKETSDGQ